MSLSVWIPLDKFVANGNVSFERVYDRVTFEDERCLEREVLQATVYHRNWGDTVREVEIVSSFDGTPEILFTFGSSAMIRNILQDICKDIGVEYEEH
tara:strand:- start:1893 stop:2183 length:291 start_codon:yes stop_codon:yes gene_type:complete